MPDTPAQWKEKDLQKPEEVEVVPCSCHIWGFPAGKSYHKSHQWATSSTGCSTFGREFLLLVASFTWRWCGVFVVFYLPHRGEFAVQRWFRKEGNEDMQNAILAWFYFVITSFPKPHKLPSIRWQCSFITNHHPVRGEGSFAEFNKSQQRS